MEIPDTREPRERSGVPRDCKEESACADIPAETNNCFAGPYRTGSFKGNRHSLSLSAITVPQHNNHEDLFSRRHSRTSFRSQRNPMFCVRPLLFFFLPKGVRRRIYVIFYKDRRRTHPPGCTSERSREQLYCTRVQQGRCRAARRLVG